MKVYLDLSPNQHHSQYDELINYPPEGVNYQLPSGEPPLSIINKLFRYIPSEKIKSGLRVIKTDVKSHARRKRNVDADLIHICDEFTPWDRPWVMDLELATSLTGYDSKALCCSRKQIEKAFSSEQCKKVMPWTNAGRITLENSLDVNKFRNKIEVVYPSIHPVPKKQERKTTKRSDKIRLLFVGSVINPRDFVWKGGGVCD